MIRKILTYPSTLLKKVSKPVETFDAELRQLIDDMFETMYDAPGVGLAAPQIGILKRILVIDVGRLEGETSHPDPKAIINPKIKHREGKIIWEEGCLSVPELTVPVERSKIIQVEGVDVDGKPVKFDGEELLAVAFQHEIDHLEGKLLTDRISELKRDLYLKKIRKIQKEGRVETGKGPTYVG